MLTLTKTRLFVLTSLSALMACSGAPSDDLSAQEQTKEQKKQENTETKTKVDAADAIDIKKVSEALGHFIGRNLKAPGIDFDTESLIKGIREGSEGKPAPMSDQEYEKAMALLQQKAMNTLAETNLSAAEKYMKDNAHASGVVEIVPGKLQYMVLEQGTGPVVPEHGTPQINYTGKYIDGTVFGSSENAGGPIAVPIDQTIQGFSKGIAGMKEGEKRRLFIHPDFGYGKTGQLPPNSLLIFDIEVVKATAPDIDPSLESMDDDSDFDEEFEAFEEDEPASPVDNKATTPKAGDKVVSPKDNEASDNPSK